MNSSLWSFFKAPAPENIGCSSSQLALFTRQLSILLGAGVPLVASLETLSRGEDPLSARVMPLVTRRVAQGSHLSAVLKGFPRVFPQTYVWMVKGAEESGTLHKLLDYLADWLDRQDKLLRQVKKGLTYPTLVLLLTFVLTIGLFRSVVPAILRAVVEVGAELPAATRALLVIVEIVQSAWFWLVFVAAIVAFTGYLRTPEGWRRVTGLMLHLPVIGNLLRCAATARMSLTLSMLLKSGTDVMRACALAGSASGLPQMAADTDRLRTGLSEGQYLSQVYGDSSLYPPLLADMLKAGEESGKLAKLVRHASTIFEEETFGRLDSVTNLLEPLVLGAISLGVGFVLIAVMMPMTSMLNSF